MPRQALLPMDLLRTFVLLMENEGKASTAQKILGVNQPGMFKRLRRFQRLVEPFAPPWFELEGNTWKATPEGRRILPAVTDLVRRYDNLMAHVRDSHDAYRCVSFACGQLAATSFVQSALLSLRDEQPTVRVEISTVRGRHRIKGVSCGRYELATVSHNQPAISSIARKDLHIEDIGKVCLALVCSTDAPWSEEFRRLSRHRVPLSALTRFPLILPSSDAGVRRILDAHLQARDLFRKLDIVLEVGGWPIIVSYVEKGFGVGLVSEAAVTNSSGLIVRRLDDKVCPATLMKLICRKSSTQQNGLDLTSEAQAWRVALIESAKRQAERLNGRTAGDADPDTDGLGPLRLGERRRDDRQGRGHDGCRADTHDDANHDELVRLRHEEAERRGAAEDHEADREQQPTAVAVAQGAGEEQ